MATTITKSPLPSADSPQIQKLSEIPEYLRVYNMVLRAEQHAVQQQVEENIVSARIVGYFLLEFHAQSGITFSDKPCTTLIGWITIGKNKLDVVFVVGKLLRDKFIRLFRTSNVRYPSPSSHPSCPAFDTLEDMIKDSMERTQKDYRTSRRKALARDGYQCTVTGLFDRNSLRHSKELQDVAARDGVPAVSIESAHILNESTTQGIDPEETSEDNKVASKTHFAAGAIAILEAFGFSNFTEAFKRSGGVHKVWNLLSLEHDLHYLFDHLDLWFEHTHQEHHYKVCVINQTDETLIRKMSSKPHVDGTPILVDFTTSFTEAPPPHPALLALHAACARVAHMSGAAEFMDQLQWDAEDMRVLAFDGSSASLLSNLISPFATIEAIP